MMVLIFNMIVESTLQKLGLNEKEIEVYLTLIKEGEGTGYSIAKLLGKKRSSIYFLLEELRKKGLVNRIPKSGKQIFVPKHPITLMEDTQRLAFDVEEMIPQLMALSPTKDAPKVTFLEGKKGYFQAMDDKEKLANKDTELMGFFCYHDNPPTDLVEANKKSFSTVISNSAGARVLTPDHPVMRKQVPGYITHPNYHVRFLPFDRYSSKTSIESIGDTVFIFSNGFDQIIKIKNEELAKTVRQIFEFVWDVSEGFDQK